MAEKKLSKMTDEELAEYRDDLNEQKVGIKTLEREADEELLVRQTLKGIPANVKRIILEGRVEVSGDASAE